MPRSNRIKMSRNKESVDDNARQKFVNYDPDLMVPRLEKNSAYMGECAVATLDVCWLGGIGNGKNNQYEACYLSNEIYRKHIKGFPLIEPYIAQSNQFGCSIYRWNVGVLYHIDMRLGIIYKNPRLYKEINNTLSKGSRYTDIKELFNSGIILCIFF